MLNILLNQLTNLSLSKLSNRTLKAHLSIESSTINLDARWRDALQPVVPLLEQNLQAPTFQTMPVKISQLVLVDIEIYLVAGRFSTNYLTHNYDLLEVLDPGNIDRRPHFEEADYRVFTCRNCNRTGWIAFERDPTTCERVVTTSSVG